MANQDKLNIINQRIDNITKQIDTALVNDDMVEYDDLMYIFDILWLEREKLNILVENEINEIYN